MSRRGWFLFLAMGVIWGTPYLLIRIAVREVSPPTLVFLRTAPAFFLLLPFVARRDVFRWLAAHWGPIVLYTIAELGIPWLFISRAEQRLPSSLAGLLVATTPFVSVVLARLTGHEERLEPRRLVGLLVGLGGVATIVGIDVQGSDAVSFAEVGIAVVGYALGPLIVSRYLRGGPPVGIVTASLGLTALAYAPVALTHLPRSMSFEILASVLILIFVCTALAFVTFFALIAEVGPTRATVVTYVNPAIAVVLGVVLLGEHFSLGIAIGFPLVLLGSWLGTHRAIEKPTPRTAALGQSGSAA